MLIALSFIYLILQCNPLLLGRIMGGNGIQFGLFGSPIDRSYDTEFYARVRWISTLVYKHIKENARIVYWFKHPALTHLPIFRSMALCRWFSSFYVHAFRSPFTLAFNLVPWLIVSDLGGPLGHNDHFQLVIGFQSKSHMHPFEN